MAAWKRIGIAGLGLALLGSGAGCGPVQYITTVTSQASSEVAAAKSANAEKYAPFEYTAAVEYLHKAREEEGYADHENAIKYGRLAKEHAEKAKKLAIEKAGTDEDPTVTPVPVETPVDAPETENPLEKVRRTK